MGRRSRTGSADRSEFWFDEGTADSAVQFIHNRCCHWQGEWAGTPFILEDWQREQIIRPMFGWKRKDPTVPRGDWPRRYQTAYIEVGKGNGKSPLVAAIGLLMLVWDCEPGAEIYSVAADRDQASIIYQDFIGSIHQSPELDERLRVFEGSRRVVYPAMRSFYRVLSSDASGKHGYRPHAILFDELHAQPNRRLYGVLRPALSKRRQPLMVMITTAGEYDETSLCWNEHEYAEAVIKAERGEDDGVNDPTHLALIYAADRDDDPGDPKVWAKANPNLGISVKVQGLENEWAQARRKGPAAQAEFKQLHLCIWAESSDGVIDMQAWNRCSGAPELTGPCFVGIDLSSKLDLTSVVAFFPETGGVLPFFWLPAENIEERKRKDVFDYPRFVRDGYITATEGSWVDQRAIRNTVSELAAQYDVREIGYDSWNATQMATWLQDEDGLTIVEMRQGTRTLSEPMKELVALVADDRIRHGGNPVLRWNGANLRARRDPNDNWAPAKDKLGRKRIDGMVALIMAIGRARLHQESVYTSRGVRAV